MPVYGSIPWDRTRNRSAVCPSQVGVFGDGSYRAASSPPVKARPVGPAVCRRHRVDARSLASQVQVNCALFMAPPIADVATDHDGCLIKLPLDRQIEVGRPRRGKSAGPSVLNPNPIGANWEKSMFVSPTGNGLKGNGLVATCIYTSAEINGLAKPIEPHAATCASCS